MFDSLYNLAHWLTGDRIEAEGLVQETYTEALRGFKPFQQGTNIRMDNIDPTFNTQNFSASPDAVQEFQIEIGSYSANMGGVSGGQVNVITRSGSSRFTEVAGRFNLTLDNICLVKTLLFL